MTSLPLALAARRAAIAAAALAAALLAHVAAAGDLDVVLAAPVAWGWVIGAAAVCGRRRAPWRSRGTFGTLGVLVAAQALMHLGMTYAPWAFGLHVHHRDALLAPAALAAHGVVAVGLGLLLARLERLLAAAVRAARTVRRLLAPRAGGARLLLPLPAHRRSRPLGRAVRPAACRGPPLPVA